MNSRINDLLNFAKQQIVHPTDIISLLSAALAKEMKGKDRSQDEDDYYHSYHDVLGDQKSTFMGYREMVLSQRWRRPNLSDIEKINTHDMYVVAKSKSAGH